MSKVDSFFEVDPGFVFKIKVIKPDNLASDAVVGFLYRDLEGSECWAMKPNWEESSGNDIWQMKPGGANGALERTTIIKLEPYASATANQGEFPTGNNMFARMSSFLSMSNYQPGSGGKYYFHTVIVKDVP